MGNEGTGNRRQETKAEIHKSPEMRSGLVATYLVEAMGIEPMSGEPSTETPTCVVGLLDLAIWRSDRQDRKTASLKSSRPNALRQRHSSQPAFSTPVSDFAG